MPSVFLQLETNDGKLHIVERALVKQMGIIREMLKLECGDTTEVIPLPRVDSETLKLLLKWCESMKSWTDDAEVSVRINILKRLIQRSGGDDEVLFQLITAANYLQMDSLLDAGTQLLANIIQSYDSAEELRLRFSIANEEE
ncbi:uncharacterized protein [Drosophila kikkawai]|uniref:SKP1 component POZ domain-containing protein n=1 Tax=Drosophila kikkawai TaxID=30033 RepID=A0A6P4J527_DROKI|nr:E3 ubiquitin ligase complex SCF subunit sconC [Drosophila kikkawai]